MSDTTQEKTDAPMDEPAGGVPTAEDHARAAQAAVDSLDELIARLEVAAEQLRSGDLSTDAAATLVEECSVLANRAGAELDRRVHAPPPGQDTLL
jgi:hypothetical protein